MTDIFKTKDSAKESRDPKQFVASLMVPSDDPTVYVPDQFAKRKWPQDVVNVKRPRFGHDY